MVMKKRLDHNSLYLSLKYRKKGIEGIPFIENMNVSILAPDSIKITVYEKSEGNWTLTNSFYACSVSKDEESEPVTVYIEDGVGYSCRYSFLLYNDNTEMETDFTDKRLKKIH